MGSNPIRPVFCFFMSQSFYPASVDPRIVAAAQKEGLPAITKQELEDLIFAMPRVLKN